MRRLDIIKNKAQPSLKLEVDQSKQISAIEQVKSSIDDLNKLLGNKKDYDFDKLATQLVIIGDKLELNEHFKALELEIKGIGDKYPKVLDINGLNELIKAVKENKVEIIDKQIDISSLQKALIEVTQAVKDTTNIDQAPDNYQPIRRVVKQGNRLVYDDVIYGGGGGGGTSNPPLSHASIAQGGAGTTTIVAAQTGLKIYVTQYTLILGANGTFKFQSGSTDLSGPMDATATSGAVVSGGFAPIFNTNVGEAFNLVTTGGAGNGHISYYVDR